MPANLNHTHTMKLPDDIQVSKLARMGEVFYNLENGNLTDAKRLARGHSELSLFLFAHTEDLFWSLERSKAAVQYLKGAGTFQAYCDAR